MRHRALALFALATAACGRDYYYVARMDVEGDALVVTFAETCPGATLHWDGRFRDGYKADLSVDAHDDDCTGMFESRFDLRPMKWALMGENPEASGMLIRVPGFDADRGPDCVLYMFSARGPNHPGLGFATTCE